MTEMTLGRTELVPLDRVRPYWRNPRRVTEEAVNALRSSIESYGYTQPIVVDADFVIIVGHTRYAAMRRMGITEVPVKVAVELSPEEVKQYRLIDNKVAELTSWDFESLTAELGELDAGLVMALFPEVTSTDAEGFTDEGQLAREWERVVTAVEFVCPSCFHTFEVEVTKDALLTGRVEATRENDDHAEHA
jgi:hypothetical protein